MTTNQLCALIGLAIGIIIGLLRVKAVMKKGWGREMSSEEKLLKKGWVGLCNRIVDWINCYLNLRDDER